MGTAIERLSSGLRINSAKDDAAGQAIANRFTANIKGLTQAGRNANDGISIAQTTEGALNEINNNLQRIRELSVQAATGSNSSTDLDTIQAEIKQRLDEINRVSEQTQFNGVHVLAKDSTLTVQVGAHDNQTIDINLKEINASTLGLGKFSIESGKVTQSANIATTATTKVGADVKITATSFNNTTAAAATTLHVGKADPDKLFIVTGGKVYDASFNANTGSIEFSSKTASTTVLTDTVAATGKVHVGGGVYQDAAKLDSATAGHVDGNPGATRTLHVDSAGALFVKVGSDYFAGSLNNGKIDYAGGTPVATAPTSVSAPLTSYRDPTAGSAVTLTAPSGTTGAALYALKDGSGYVVKANDAQGNELVFAAEVSSKGAVTVGAEQTTDPLAALDKALQQVDSLRSDLGAVQNRFQSTIANLSNTVNNLSAARSRIQDADYAVEVSNMTRAQILQQAGTSVLAQANQVPQTVLSLLR